MKFSPPLTEDFSSNKTYFDQWNEKLKTQAKAELSEALIISPVVLFKEHLETWESIWKTGFSLSRSLAPSVINGDVINRTMYYVLSTAAAPLYEFKSNETRREELQRTLFQIDQCYESHSTL